MKYERNIKEVTAAVGAVVRGESIIIMCVADSHGAVRNDSTAWLILAITFSDTFMIGLVNPIYPALVQSHLLGGTLYALIMSTANGAALVGATLYGRFSDTHGRRSAILACVATTWTGFMLYALGLACDGWSSASHIRLALPAVGRVVSGMGRSSLAGPLMAQLADQATSTAAATGGDSGKAAARSATRIVATFGFGYAIGSGFGGLLQAWTLLQGFGAWSNLALMLVCSTTQMLCAWQLPDARVPVAASGPLTRARANAARTTTAATTGLGSRRAASSTLSALTRALAVPSTRALLLLQACTAASFHVYDSTSALYMQDALRYTSSQRGYILSCARAPSLRLTPGVLTLSRPLSQSTSSCHAHTHTHTGI